MPKLAPFFLPTVANEQGFTFKSLIDAGKQQQKNSSANGHFGVENNKPTNLFLSDFATKLSKATSIADCKASLTQLNSTMSLVFY